MYFNSLGKTWGGPDDGSKAGDNYPLPQVTLYKKLKPGSEFASSAELTINSAVGDHCAE